MTASVSAPARPVALVVHADSVPYVQSVAAYIRQQLLTHAGREPLYAECREVHAAAPPPHAVMFVIGDGFPLFSRRDDCRYVFVNFSLLKKLRWWRPIAGDAARWIRTKHAAFQRKVHLYDLVLDFNPRQATLLARARAGAPAVRPFLTGTWDHGVRQPAAPQWDVCFTGTETPRRSRIRLALGQRGISVSPARAPGLAAVIHRCRAVLNVHAFDCDTLETARVVHALSAGVPLVTETSYGLGDVAPPHCYVSAAYRRIPDAVEALLRDPVRLETMGACAARHMQVHYAPRAEASWRSIVREAVTL